MGGLALQQGAGRTTFRLVAPPVSGVLRLRAMATSAALAGLVLVALCVSVSVGDYPVPLADVVRALGGSGDEGTLLVVRELRLPRALVGLLVGASLGMAGAILQALARNALATPDIIGITQGASAAVVAGMVAGFGGGLETPGLALVGAFTAALAIFLLSWRRGGTGYRMVLVGIGVGALFLSVTQYLLVRAQIFEAQRAVVWLIGSLNSRDWAHVRPLAWAMVVLVPLALATGRSLGMLAFGDDTARGLGVRVNAVRLLLLGAGVGLAAFATASSGPIAFVALLAPHIARRLAHLAEPPLLTSALVGSFIVLASDLVARRFLSSAELPVGIVTAVLGAPFLLWLLARAQGAGAGA